MTHEAPVKSQLRHGVAEEVRVLLARRRLSAARLAQQLGWSQPYMARRMAGTQPFDVDDLEAIADALGVGIVDLLPRDRREQVTGQYPPTVSGTVSHPRHPIVTGAVPLPLEIRHGDARRERRIGRKVDAAITSTQRIPSVSLAVMP